LGIARAIQSAVEAGEYTFNRHALERAEERDISPSEIEEALLATNSEVIEDYPDDFRGPSCLILCWTANGRPLHVQVCYPPLVEVVTVYEPDQTKWRDFRRRR
jgi:hypothetical protein